MKFIVLQEYLIKYSLYMGIKYVFYLDFKSIKFNFLIGFSRVDLK
jgi:hypothetical protein